MHTINIKPLSVNEAWQGRRYKTHKYKSYEKELSLLLPNIKVNKDSRLKIKFEFGFSNVLSDLDNPVKLIQDVMQKKYKFNDSKVFELNLKKVVVKKGNEYIKFKITEI